MIACVKVQPSLDKLFASADVNAKVGTPSCVNTTARSERCPEWQASPSSTIRSVGPRAASGTSRSDNVRPVAAASAVRVWEVAMTKRRSSSKIPCP